MTLFLSVKIQGMMKNFDSENLFEGSFDVLNPRITELDDFS
jgi:hypothetical protein